MKSRLVGVGVAGLVLAGLTGFVVCRVAFGPFGSPARPSATHAKTEAARLQAKRDIAQDVIAGRRTLLEAAAAFQDADGDGPPRVQATAASLGAASEEEGYCRSVIEWVRTEAPPERADDLTRRLEAELRAALREGRLRGPQAVDR